MMVESRRLCFTQVQMPLRTPSQGGIRKLRKLISTVTVACALLACTAGAAMATGKRVSNTRCGNKYTPACTKPRITNRALSAKCVPAGSRLTLPKITFTSNAGIRRIQIREGSRLIKQIRFRGRGPTQFSFKHLTISTLRLVSGGHPLTVEITDVKRRSKRKTLRFSVCKSTPVFTG